MKKNTDRGVWIMLALPLNDMARARRRKALVGIFAWTALLAGVALLPQSAPQAQSSPTPQFCYNGQCRESLPEAVALMRADPQYAPLSDKLELAETNVNELTGMAEYIYRIPPVKAEVVYDFMFLGEVPGQNGSTFAQCPPPSPDPHPDYSQFCSDESSAYNAARQIASNRVVQMGCAPTSARLVQDLTYLPDGYYRSDSVVNQNRRVEMDFGLKIYAQDGASCPDDSTTTVSFLVHTRRNLVCPEGYAKFDQAIPTSQVEDAPICLADYPDAVITGPFQQTDSEAANCNPCHPATGDKSRAETDFVFAGRPFTRYYHSLQQVPGSPDFAAAWYHPYSDRIRPVVSAALQLFDGRGTLEVFKTYDGTHYFGNNSRDRRIERISSGEVRYRLRSAGGGVREYDANGGLIAVRDLQAPQNDLRIVRANGRIDRLVDARGREAVFGYAGGLLASITLPDGAVYRYGYDANRNLVSVDYGNNRIKRYHYAEAGLVGNTNHRHHLTGITAESGLRFASFRYDARGRVLSSTVHGTPADVTLLEYDAADHVTVTTAHGGTRGYTMQPGLYRRILSVSESDGTQSRTYNADGLPETMTDKRGFVMRYGYTNGYVSSMIEAEGTPQQRRTEIVRDPTHHGATEQRVRDAAGALVARTTYAYNTRGQITAVTAHDPANGANRTATLSYCEPGEVTAGICPLVGLVKAIDGPRSDVSDVVTFTYRQTDHPDCATAPTTCAWRKGDLWKTTNAAGHVTEVLTYDGAGRATSIRDPNGITTTLQYDTRGWLTRRTVLGDPSILFGDAVTQIDYTADGLVRKLTRRDGSFTLFDYDAGQRLTTVADSDGNAIVYTLNAAGERIAERTYDATGGLTREMSRAFDTLGRLARTIDANNAATVLVYDQEGNLTGSTDPLLRATGSAYDALGRMTASLGNANAPAGASDHARITYAYDALDRLTRVTDPKGLPTDYAYNGFGERTQLNSPDTGITTFGFDAAGNQVTSTDARGVTTHVAYDALSRPTTVTYPSDASQNVGFTYDTASGDCAAGETFLTGRLARMTDASGNTTWCYDRYGQLTQKLQRTDNRAYSLRYLWAPPPSGPRGPLSVHKPGRGKFYGWRYPDGAEVRVSQDREGRVSQLTVVTADGRKQLLLAHARYHPFGAPAGWDWGNGLIHRRTVDRNYRPGIIQTGTQTGSQLTANPTSLSLGYQFDAVGNLVALRDGDQSEPALRTYGYDGLDRLTAVRDGANNQLQQGYAYDATGNRTSANDGAATTTYSYATSSHRLTTVGTQNRSYDAAGNTTRIGGAAQTALPQQAATQSAFPLWRQPPEDGQAMRRAGGADSRTREQVRTPASANARWQAPATARAGMRSRLQDLRARRDGPQVRDSDDGSPRTFWQWRQREQATTTAHAPASDRMPSSLSPTTASAGGSAIAAKAFPANIVRDFAYNAANRMSEVKHNGATVMQYRYNGIGEQVLKFSASQRIVTVYDEAGRWIGDYESTTGNPIQQVIWLHDLPVGLLVGAGASQTLYYIESDMLGTPRVVLNPMTSQAVWRWDLEDEAFGDSAPNEDPDQNGQPFVFDMRFPGQRHDAASGLSQNYYREYDSGTGRYGQSDPIGFAGGISTYSYANAAPTLFIDRLGLAGGVGHHYVPRAVFGSYPLPEEARRVFDRATTGSIPGGHGWDKAHSQYNKAVGEALQDWLSRGGVDPSRMTAQQAEDFMQHLSRSSDPRITSYIASLEKKMGKSLLKRGGGFVCRKFPVLAVGFFVYDAQAEGVGYAANELVWPISELWTDD